MASRPEVRVFELSDETLEAICLSVAEGNSLKRSCTASGITDVQFLRWCGRHADAAKQYAHALECRAVFHADRIGELAEGTVAGEHDPQAARVAIDAYKWTAARMAPKRYGDKIQTEVSAAPDLSATLAALIDRLPQ